MRLSLGYGLDFGGYRSGGYHSGYDADAQAYFNAVESAGGNLDYSAAKAGSTRAVVMQAIDRLFRRVKAIADWSKIDNLCPFVGGQAASHILNGRNLTENLTAAGTITHSSAGWVSDGSTGYMRAYKKAYQLFGGTAINGMYYEGSIAFWNGSLDSARSGYQTEGKIGRAHV